METIELFERFGLAIAIGAVVGVERHWRERDEEAGQRTAGLRTFTLSGMLGGLAAFIDPAPSSPGLVLTGMFVVFSAVFALFQYREAVVSGNHSVTSVVAAMSTFALGALAVSGSQTLAAAGGVTLAAVLASRGVLHGFMRTLTWTELRSAIIFLAMAFVILPIIPVEPVGPFGGISPAGTWKLVVLLAGVSFIGYAAVKAFGPTQGELLAGAVGGLISSTGVSITNARLSRSLPTMPTLLAGALAANAVSCAKVAVLAALLAPQMAARIGPALAVTAAVMALAATVLARRQTTEHAAISPRNPFEIGAVVKMAVLLVVIAFLARAATAWLGQAGLIAVSVLSGLADVDAVTVTVTGMIGQIGTEFACIALGAAVISNTVAKSAYAFAFGTAAFGTRFAAVGALALLAGIAVFQITPAVLPLVGLTVADVAE
ncbi:DUF4010 domain-containing protein [Rhizobiaceae bacterium BDR2-2]|uniref:DUF4010 domain-containing protein n=1 Tax=Ectorhizobium quercum TaxID=2965071 RepID=A0AAE3N1F9_9HYPH|nr:DUF4010 domain-containing protein [Ectorhizobium quercum]MCX8998161.1 DUF4010 domain-containing protein [Ectorhizobium quercum]